MRLGLTTGGGDCPGLNAVIRAVVKHAVGGLGYTVLGIKDGLTGIVDAATGTRPLTVQDVQDIHEIGGTILGTNNRGSPFRNPDQAAKIIKDIKAGWAHAKLDAMIVVGGDGTQFMARSLVDAGLKIVGVPKTIDNDLKGTDMTVGFATAVEIASDAAARLYTSAEAHNRIMVLEVMGRDAGHIALHTGIASGAHAVLIPEVPFSYDVLVERIRRRSTLGRSGFLVVIAEGAEPGGVEVARILSERTGIDARTTILGHLQRGGRPTAPDRILGAQLGKHAVDLVARGNFGRLVGVREGRIIDFPYKDVTDTRRLVELTSELVTTAEAIGISLGRDAAYTAPL